MTTYNKPMLLAAASALCIPVTAMADGWYGSAMLGYSQQVLESEPFGSNIAVDPDFPAEFDSGDGGLGFIGVGYRFDERLRVEGRLGFRRGEFRDTEFGTGERAGEEYILDGDIEATTLSLDGFYDIRTNTILTPYLKVGLGLSRNEYSARLGGAGVAEFDPFDGTVDGFYDSYADQTSTNLSWNVGFGGSVSLSEKITLFAEYQYISLGDAETDPDDFTDGFRIDNAAAHEAMLGIRLTF